ncbi:acyl-CoA thioesterase [Peribacillus asahii]|uniref:Acyl-CoA thioesterase n=1 Tax=Peribacillus asahii TaxID=228899 RepID=A0A398AZF3_9BACI|nr:thioesterase family protein [Peribacillus asahii]RID82424.1 acyl-CoA thioesterase [Peribacillus asahii]
MNNIPEIDVYVRFCETDAAGHVNNISYFIYMEEARTKFFKAVGYDKDNRGEMDFVVASAQCDYLAQAYANQTLTLSTRVSKIGTKSYTLAHEIKSADTGAMIAVGSAVVVCFNFQTQQSEVIPPELRSTLEQYLVTV